MRQANFIRATDSPHLEKVLDSTNPGAYADEGYFGNQRPKRPVITESDAITTLQSLSECYDHPNPGFGQHTFPISATKKSLVSQGVQGLQTLEFDLKTEDISKASKKAERFRQRTVRRRVEEMEASRRQLVAAVPPRGELEMNFFKEMPLSVLAHKQR